MCINCPECWWPWSAWWVFALRFLFATRGPKIWFALGRAQGCWRRSDSTTTWHVWSFRFVVNICELCDRLRQGELSGGFANILKLEVAIATLATCYHVLHLASTNEYHNIATVESNFRPSKLKSATHFCIHLYRIFDDNAHIWQTHTETEKAGFNALNRQISYEVTSHSNIQMP